MDLNKWNRSVGSFDKSAADESDNRENKLDLCKTSKNLSKAHDHEQQEQDNDNGNGNDNENSVTNEDENKAATTIIISPLNRTLLKKPTTHKNANNYNNNLNDNNNNNKNNNLNSENSNCNINCSVNENDYQCKNNDYQFSKPITKNLKQQQQHNHNFISKRAENTFACSMLEKCASANFPNSSHSSCSSHVESDNEQEQEQDQDQEQEQENSKAQVQLQLQLQLQTQENQNDRPVDDVDATNKLSSRNAAAHITGFETGVVGVCCGSISVGASVDFAAVGDSSNSSFILNLHKKPNLAVTSITTTQTTTTTKTATTTNASSDHNSTSNTNETSVTAKCHNCCNNNNNNNNNNSNNNNNNSSNYCRN